MKNKFKLIAFLFVQIGLLSLSYQIGFQSGYKFIEKKVTILQVLDNLSIYNVLKEIAQNLKNENSDYARCTAQLNAKIYFKSLKRCAEDDDCKLGILPIAKKSAPEIMGEELPPIEFPSSCKVPIQQNDHPA